MEADACNAWCTWLSGKTIGDVNVWGPINVQWLGRVGKLIQLAAASTIIIEIIGTRRLRRLFRRAQANIDAPEGAPRRLAAITPALYVISACLAIIVVYVAQNLNPNPGFLRRTFPGNDLLFFIFQTVMIWIFLHNIILSWYEERQIPLLDLRHHNNRKFILTVSFHIFAVLILTLATIEALVKVFQRGSNIELLTIFVCACLFGLLVKSWTGQGIAAPSQTTFRLSAFVMGKVLSLSIFLEEHRLKAVSYIVFLVGFALDFAAS